MNQAENVEVTHTIAGYDKRVTRYKALGFWGTETFDQVFDRSVKKNPEKVAIIDDYGQITYRQFKTMADMVAVNLRKAGIGRGDVVTVQLPNWKEAIIALYAVSRLGAVFMPISPNYRLHDAGSMIKRAGAKALILPSFFINYDFTEMAIQLRSEIESLEHVWMVGNSENGNLNGLLSWETLLEPATETIETQGDPEDIALLLYSSGTTGVPKGVMHSHCSWLRAVYVGQTAFALDDSDVHLFTLPVVMAYGLSMLCLAISLGGTSVFQERYVCEGLFKLCNSHGVTFIPLAPPHVFDMVNNAENNQGTKLPDLKYILSSGAPTPSHILSKAKEHFGCIVFSNYGMSENLAVTCSRQEDSFDLIATTSGIRYELTEVDIVDDNKKSLPKGTTGEIALRGPTQFLGYYKDPELTAECHGDDDWFYTGDLAQIGEDDRLRFAGRKKEMIIRGGLNIDPKEVETLLIQHPSVAQAAVVGFPDERLGEIVCACIVPSTDQKAPELDEIITFLREKGLSSQKLPQKMEIMPDFPLTATMKIRKVQMRDDLIQKSSSSDPIDSSPEVRSA